MAERPAGPVTRPVRLLLVDDHQATLDAKLLVTPNINLIVEAMNGKIHVETDPAGVNGRKPD